ncbi:asparaginase domain-containing protein [Actinoallomurus liliacearum]
MSASVSPPPWPIPPSWQVALPGREPDAEPDGAPAAGAPSDGYPAVAPPATGPSGTPVPDDVSFAISPSPGPGASVALRTGAGPADGATGDVPAGTVPGGGPEIMPRLVVVFLPEGSGAMVDAMPSLPNGVRVERRPAAGPVSTFAGVGELARAVGEAVAGGASGVVVVHPAETLAETAWALELLHEGSAPIALVAASGGPSELADAIAVAAAGPRWLGCAVVAHGDIHAARHVRATGIAAPAFASPGAGPLGQVIGGIPRLLWRPPERFTVRGPFAGRPPRVGLHVVALGDDGALLRALAGHCDGLIVAARAGQAALAALVPVLAETAARIPVVLHSPTATPGGMAVTGLEPLKARVLMHLLLDAGHDRAAVLNAFAALEGNAAAPSAPSPVASAF